MTLHTTDAAPPATGPPPPARLMAIMHRTMSYNDIRTRNFAGVWGKGMRIELSARILESGEIWYVEASGYGLSRKRWLEAWHAEQVEVLRWRGRWRDTFSVRLKRDRPKPLARS